MKKLAWVPLSEQRARTKITTFYKGLNNLVEIPIDQYKMELNKRTTRQSGYQIFSVPPSNVDSHLYSFFPSTIRLWNNLPAISRTAKSVDDFKRAIVNVNLRK